MGLAALPSPRVAECGKLELVLGLSSSLRAAHFGGGERGPTPRNGAGRLSFASVVSVVKVKPKVVFLPWLLEVGWFVLVLGFFFGGVLVKVFR